MGERFVFYNAMMSMWVLSYKLYDDSSVGKSAEFLFSSKSKAESPDRVTDMWSILVKGELADEKTVKIRCGSCQSVQVDIPDSSTSISVGRKTDATVGVKGMYAMNSELSYEKPVFKNSNGWFLYYTESTQGNVGEWAIGKSTNAKQDTPALLAVSNAKSPDKIRQKHDWRVTKCKGGILYCHHHLHVTCSAPTTAPSSSPTLAPTTPTPGPTAQTVAPTPVPSISPTVCPTSLPTDAPTTQPTDLPIPGCEKLELYGIPDGREWAVLMGW
jgi:hypothetical protein